MSVCASVVSREGFDAGREGGREGGREESAVRGTVGQFQSAAKSSRCTVSLPLWVCPKKGLSTGGGWWGGVKGKLFHSCRVLGAGADRGAVNLGVEIGSVIITIMMIDCDCGRRR